jgi:hypothetical protein
MKKVQLSFCLFLIASALQAQVTIGPKIGLNVNYESFQFSGNYSGTSVSSRTAKVGYQAGLAINVKTSDYFSIRPEVLFNVMGGDTKFGDNNNNSISIKNTYNYLSVPLNFVGTFQAGPGKINVFVAPQFSLGLSGKYSQTSDSSGVFVTAQSSQSGMLQTGNVPSNNNSSTRYFNQMSWGMNYGIGYQVGGLLFSGQYHMGITNTQPHYADSNQESHRNDVVSKNYGFTVGLTYFFGDTKNE